MIQDALPWTHQPFSAEQVDVLCLLPLRTSIDTIYITATLSAGSRSGEDAVIAHHVGLVRHVNLQSNQRRRLCNVLQSLPLRVSPKTKRDAYLAMLPRPPRKSTTASAEDWLLLGPDPWPTQSLTRAVRFALHRYHALLPSGHRLAFQLDWRRE
ncbi:hypothetical protein H0G86_010129 [Trichoderma simmonsii]|uniref:Uncharacterized protein n=1 Tax=Trichoderma simmonsii TaxID=1491479 RepID=A0A8G0LNW6_9HYPO|nr:hypothetical protein H0G86_010129 [Trichoderma simmonsii]